MCGFAGYWGEKQPVTDTAVALRMLDRVRHRGPDDQGLVTFSLSTGIANAHETHVATPVDHAEGWIGFNRLSIQDLSVNGHQPMFSRDGKVVVVLNGEIYNVAELRSSLEREGIRFRGHSDTEVFLEYYQWHGIDKAVKALNGMFAIVVIDLLRGELLLIRDRFGIKPLYALDHQGGLAFASELKSFLDLEEFKPRLRRKGLDEYLLFRNNLYQTLYEGIHSILPGTYVRLTPGKAAAVVTYFSISSLTRESSLDAATEIRRRTGQALEAAVHRQLISDVSVGCQLSGGIDSSLVTQLASERQPGMQTISITFSDPAYNEASFVDQVVATSRVTAHKFELDADYYVKAFERATWHFEAPLNHPNTIGLFLLSERARKHVTVLLSGEGADELFGGYGRFARVSNPWNARAFYSYWRSHGYSLRPAYPYFDHGYRTLLSSAYLTPELAGKVLPDFDPVRALGERKSIYDQLTGEGFDRHLQYELSTFLPDLLHRQDTMSMAHSIENRVPFLDHELVDWAFHLPHAMLRGNGSPGQAKLVLKELAAARWGESFAFRNKSGFSIPLRSFFSNPQFAAWINDVIMPGVRSRGLFNAQTIEPWWKNLATIPTHELEALWIIFAFECWAQTYKVTA